MENKETALFYQEKGKECFVEQKYWLSASYFESTYKIVDRLRGPFDKRARLIVLDQLCSALTAHVSQPAPLQKATKAYKQYQESQKKLEMYSATMLQAFPQALRAYLRRGKAILALKSNKNTVEIVLKLLLRAAKLVKVRLSDDLPQYASDNGHFVAILDKQIRELTLKRKLILEQELKCIDPFVALPQDVIYIILTHLPFDDVLRCLQVSQTWTQTLYQHPRIFQTLALTKSQYNDSLHADFIKKHLQNIRRPLRLQSLSIDVPKVCSSRQLTTILHTYKPKTLLVNFNYPEASDTRFSTQFAQNVHNLELHFLKPIGGIPPSSLLSTDNILDMCPLLETLTLRCSKFNDSMARAAAVFDSGARNVDSKKLKLQFKVLRLIHTPKEPLDALTCYRRNLIKFLPQVPNLETLELRCVHATPSYSQLSMEIRDEGLPLKNVIVSHTCSGLNLQLSPSELRTVVIDKMMFTKRQVSEMFSNHTVKKLNVESLVLRQCIGPSATLFIDRLLQHIDPFQVRRLELSQCTYSFGSRAFWAFLKGCCNLEELNIANGSIKNEDFLRLADMNFMSLSKLDVSHNTQIRSTSIARFLESFSTRIGAQVPEIYFNTDVAQDGPLAFNSFFS